MKLVVVAFAALTLLPGHVRAADVSFSGNAVLESCRRLAMLKAPISTEDAFLMGECGGMTRTLVAIEDQLSPNARFCLPEAVTFQQANKVFVAFLDAHPERLHELSTVLAMNAFRAAWPCGASDAKQ
jgi:Rap1a immunity proteins